MALKHVDVNQLLIDAYGSQVRNAIDCPIFHALENAGFQVTDVDYAGFTIIDAGEWLHLEFPGGNALEAPVRQWQEYGPGPAFSFDVDTENWTVQNLSLPDFFNG